MGRSQIASRVFNCNAPDTGNAEILAQFGTEQQKQEYLIPLLEGEARSCFSMTEPDTAGSDPTGLRTTAVRDGDDWVINGHKWFTSGAIGAKFAITMVVTNSEGAPHERASMILVPTDAPGFDLIRPVSVMGHVSGGGHCEIQYNDCRVPAENLLGPLHGGFMISQARLGPGRIHHCMRAIGSAERAFEIMCRHANMREVGGVLLREKQFVQEWIATSRMEIDQSRLLTNYAAWKMDKYGKENARQELSMTKVVVPNMMMNVLDRAIQCLGALGVSDDTPIASMWRNGRALRIADGADEVHKMVIARRELKRFA
jgi:acyl-CoA dehydrogenase